MGELTRQSQPEVIAQLVKAGDALAARLARSPGIDMMRSFDLKDWQEAKEAAGVR